MDKYEIIDRLGRGSYGSVIKARNISDGKIVAIKEIDYGNLSNTKQKQMLVNEVNILRKLRCKYIVKYISHIVDKEKKFIYLVMDYCERGDIQAVIRDARSKRMYIDENMIWHTITEMALALKTCHYGEKKIIHRDIKPGNIFISGDGYVKLGDFGFARTITDELAKTIAGTHYYMSPELTEGNPYDEKSDIWALGCVIYELADLNPPFMGPGPDNLKKNILSGKMRRIPGRYSESLWNMIQWMLSRDPIKRPTVIDILQRNPVNIYVKLLKMRDERTKYEESAKKLQKMKQKLQQKLEKLISLESTDSHIPVLEQKG